MVIVAVIAVLAVRTIAIAGPETAADQQRLANVIVPVVQLIISLTMLALIRNQVSVAVGQIEQAEQSETRLLQLAAAVHALVDALNAPAPVSYRTVRRSDPPPPPLASDREPLGDGVARISRVRLPRAARA